MAAGKSSKNFADYLAQNREVKAPEPKPEQPKKIVEEKKEEVIKAPKPDPITKEEKPAEKKERVRDASTILSLLLTPEQKAFIKFEAEIRKMSMNEYICSLIQEDYKRDKEMFSQYQEMLKRMQK